MRVEVLPEPLRSKVASQVHFLWNKLPQFQREMSLTHSGLSAADILAQFSTGHTLETSTSWNCGLSATATFFNTKITRPDFARIPPQRQSWLSNSFTVALSKATAAGSPALRPAWRSQFLQPPKPSQSLLTRRL